MFVHFKAIQVRIYAPGGWLGGFHTYASALCLDTGLTEWLTDFGWCV